jgi:hypothetical protein
LQRPQAAEQGRRGGVAATSREVTMMRKFASGQYRLHPRKKDPRTGRRRDLGIFGSRPAAKRHAGAVQPSKHRG